MYKKNKGVVFIGPMLKNQLPIGGAVAKNQILYSYFNNEYGEIYLIDTIKWKKSIIPFFKILVSLIIYRKRIFIVSINTNSAFLFSKALYFIIKPKELYYFIIGNTIENSFEIGKFDIKFYSIYKKIFSESKKTCKYLLKKGMDNVVYLPNLKNINQQIGIEDKHFPSKKQKIKFVFLSRIIPEKGVELIIDAVINLNNRIGANSFDVTFFGPIDIEYRIIFKERIKQIENISYLGFLDFKDVDAYRILASYDVMLFPTFWHGEGFPGIIIDAFISFLPVIASDWSINDEFIIDGENGFIIETKSVSHLVEKMLFFINNPFEIKKMSLTSNKRAKLYDVYDNLNKYF